MLPKQRERDLRELQEGEYRKRREQYLSLYRIDAARLPDISDGEVATLHEYGIDTAADVFGKLEKLIIIYPLQKTEGWLWPHALRLGADTQGRVRSRFSSRPSIPTF